MHVIYSEIHALVKNLFGGFGPDVTLSFSYGPNHDLKLIPTVVRKMGMFVERIYIMRFGVVCTFSSIYIITSENSESN